MCWLGRRVYFPYLNYLGYQDLSGPKWYVSVRWFFCVSEVMVSSNCEGNFSPLSYYGLWKIFLISPTSLHFPYGAIFFLLKYTPILIESTFKQWILGHNISLEKTTFSQLPLVNLWLTLSLLLLLSKDSASRNFFSWFIIRKPFLMWSTLLNVPLILFDPEITIPDSHYFYVVGSLR